MALNIPLLRRLAETPGISGREERVRVIVSDELRPLADDVSVDRLGNVVAWKRGKNDRRVMLAAHMEEIGFIVKYIDKDSFMRIQPVGGFDARVLFVQRIWVHGFAGESLRGMLMPSSKPIHLLGVTRSKKKFCTLTTNTAVISGMFSSVRAPPMPENSRTCHPLAGTRAAGPRQV